MRDLGSVDWMARTAGNLTTAERFRLLSPVLDAQLRNLIDRLRLLADRAPSHQATLDELPAMPDTGWVQLASEAAAATQPAVLREHAHRTWAFGRALADLDGVDLDAEGFAVACLLHDQGLADVRPARCFTALGAEEVRRTGDLAGVPAARRVAVGEAVTRHITPGATVARDGALATYVQQGASLDVVGLRYGDVERGTMRRVIDAHPRAGFATAIRAAWNEEAATVPGGRAAFLRTVGLFTVAMRIAPFGPADR